MAIQINFRKNDNLIHSVMCECEPENCPYLAYVKNNTAYNYWYRNYGNSLWVYLTDGCRGNKLCHPATYCSKCFNLRNR